MEFPVDRFTKVDNKLMKKGQLYNGVDFARIFGLNRILNKAKKKPSIKELYANQKKDLLDVYTLESIHKMFYIPLNSVETFIAYINKNGFEESLLEKKNELQLIEFLLTQSKRFLELKDE